MSLLAWLLATIIIGAFIISVSDEIRKRYRQFFRRGFILIKKIIRHRNGDVTVKTAGGERLPQKLFQKIRTAIKNGNYNVCDVNLKEQNFKFESVSEDKFDIEEGQILEIEE